MRDYYLSIIFGGRAGWVAIGLRGLLGSFSWVYTGIVYLMRLAYQCGALKSYDLGRPVISVGNITWGGVGKTPLVEWIVHECLNSGKNPVVLMRGYMAQESDAESDEAQLLTDAFDERVPVIAQKDRVQGALKVPADYAHDVFVLDDGFQHWRVKRDLNIVVIDAMDPFGNGAVIPRGSLRESLRVLKYANMIVLTKCDIGQENLISIEQELTKYCPDIPVVKSVHGFQNFYDLRKELLHDLSLMRDESAVLVSGIGSPDGFEQIVRGLGVDVKAHLCYQDHYVYEGSDVEKICQQLEKYQILNVVITGKDAVKMKMLIGKFPENIRVLSLNIKIVIQEGEGVLRHAISTVCHY